MDILKFQSLSRDVCAHLGAENTDELAKTGQIRIGDINVGLIFDENHADRLFCYVDIGSLEALDSSGHGIAMYRDMLTLNLLRGSKTTGVIALDPGNNHLVLTSHLMDPDSYDGTRLVVVLQDHVTDSVFARKLWAARLEAQVPETPAHEMNNLV